MTLTSITVGAAFATVAVGSTDQMTATGNYSDGTDKDLTALAAWSSSPAAVATVTNGGLVTGVAAGSATITATYTGVAGSMAVTVKPAIAITSMTPSVFRCDAECGFVTAFMMGSGFQVGDIVNTVPNAWLQLVQLVNSGESKIIMGLDTPHSSPGSFAFTDCRGTTTTICSNSWSVAFTGSQNDLVIGPDGELYNLDRVAGNVWKFKADGSSDGAIGVGPLGEEASIAFDAVNNLVWVNERLGGNLNGYSAATGSNVSGNTAGNMISDSDAEAGVYCGTENTVGDIACFETSGSQLPVAYSPSGTEPWSLVMLMLNSGTQSQETDAFAYDREGTALYDFVVTLPSGADTPTITLKSMPGETPNPLILNGLTPADTLANTGNGGWYLVRFAAGPAAGTLALLSAYDNALVFVNASTMTATKQVALDLPAQPATGTPFRIAADETNGRVIVALANVGASISTTFLAVTPAGVVTPLAAVAQNIIAVGLGVSSDGTKVYACMRNQCQALPNQ